MDKPVSAHFIESHSLLKDPVNFSFSLIKKKKKKDAGSSFKKNWVNKMMQTDSFS